MTDILGSRLKVGALVPSVNSSVEPEFAAMSVKGVTSLAARIQIPNQRFSSDADAAAIVAATEPDLLPAVDRLISCNPDRIIMAMAVPCFWGGVAGSAVMQKKLDERAGVPVLLRAGLKHSGSHTYRCDFAVYATGGSTRRKLVCGIRV